MKNFNKLHNIYKIQLIIALVFIMSIVFFVSYNECHYSREGYLLHTTFDNLVMFVDDCGNEWEMFTDGEPFIDGQNVRVKFFDHNTPFHIKDDEIVSYKFINWFRLQNQNWKANSKLKLKSRFKNTNQIGLCFYFSFFFFNFYLLMYKYYNIFNLHFVFLFMNT